MTAPAPAGWYPNSDAPPGQRYWDGVAWTEHVAPGGAQPPLTHRIRPGLVAVWITAVLSVLHFSVGFGNGEGWTTIALPIGLISMGVCWHLVGRAAADARLHGMSLRGDYTAARITAGVLGALSLLTSILITFG